jgi:hypothetical protein
MTNNTYVQQIKDELKEYDYYCDLMSIFDYIASLVLCNESDNNLKYYLYAIKRNTEYGKLISTHRYDGTRHGPEIFVNDYYPSKNDITSYIFYNTHSLYNGLYEHIYSNGTEWCMVTDGHKDFLCLYNYDGEIDHILTYINESIYKNNVYPWLLDFINEEYTDCYHIKIINEANITNKLNIPFNVKHVNEQSNDIVNKKLNSELDDNIVIYNNTKYKYIEQENGNILLEKLVIKEHPI